MKPVHRLHCGLLHVCVKCADASMSGAGRGSVSQAFCKRSAEFRRRRARVFRNESAACTTDRTVRKRIGGGVRVCARGGGGVRNRRGTETCSVLTLCIHTCAGHTPAFVTYSAARRNPCVHGDLICTPSLRSHAFVPSYFFQQPC